MAEDVGGYDTGGFAPVDFGDAEDTRPLGASFDIGGHGSTTPYTNAVQAIVAKHISEIQAKTKETVPGGWKRRLREFITLKNTELLDFLKVSVQSHPTLGPAEILLRRFGNPSVHPAHPSVRDLILDGSGTALHVEALNAALDAATTDLSGTRRLAAGAKALYDAYTDAGDELLKQQSRLSVKLGRLDRLQGKLSLLLEIDPTETFHPLLDATEDFMKKVFEESAIEPDYVALIDAYRRFAAAREALQMIRAPAAIEHEPLCCICLHESVSYAVTPCGHTFCQTCVRRQLSTCFFCRGPIKDRIKLYFG